VGRGGGRTLLYFFFQDAVAEGHGVFVFSEWVFVCGWAVDILSWRGRPGVHECDGIAVALSLPHFGAVGGDNVDWGVKEIGHLGDGRVDFEA